MNEPNDPFRESGPDEALGRRIKGLYPVPGVPSEMERAILAMPRLHLATQRRKRMLRWTLWGSTGAVAAAVLAAAWIGMGTRHSASGPLAMGRPAPALDRSVDIRDAYYLARELKAGVHDPAWDVNHDGVVDQKDVDALAKEAVSLKRGTI